MSQPVRTIEEFIQWVERDATQVRAPDRTLVAYQIDADTWRRLRARLRVWRPDPPLTLTVQPGDEPVSALGIVAEFHAAEAEEEHKVEEEHVVTPTQEGMAWLIADAKAQAWDACVLEAHDLGWLHDTALMDLKGRNPYR